MQKDFDGWNKLKKAIDASDDQRLYFHEGDIWWVRLGVNVGYEIDGKQREFSRPVVVLRKYNQYSFWRCRYDERQTEQVACRDRRGCRAPGFRGAFPAAQHRQSASDREEGSRRGGAVSPPKESGQPHELRLAGFPSFSPLAQGEPKGHLYSE
jgi:hypothetical protein